MTEKRMAELRRLQLTLSGATIRRLMEFGIEWQEVTGKLLKSAGKPGWEEKSVDVYARKKELRDFENSGVLRK